FVFYTLSLHDALPIFAWVASVFTFVYCMIIVFKTFFGEYKGRHHENKQFEPPIGMLISPIILGLFVVAIFFTPNLVGKYLIYPADRKSTRLNSSHVSI